MKKIMFYMVVAFMMLSFVPAQLKASEDNKTVSVSTSTTVESTDAAQLARLEEIKAMDLSILSRSEKKELRNEVKAIKNDQDEHRRRGPEGRREYNGGRRHGGVVMVTAGGGLLLILLLILLL